MSKRTFEKEASGVLSVLGNPFRIRIAVALKNREACVCHLEQLLKKRQAYISQHLMVMRDAGLLETRRDGKYIYYRLADEAIMDLIQQAAAVAGFSAEDMPGSAQPAVLASCDCPSCDLQPQPAGMPHTVLDTATQ